MMEPILPVPADLYERLAALEVAIEAVSVEGLALETASGWIRRTSVVVVEGAGVQGRGEDVTYAGTDHDDLQAGRIDLGMLLGVRPLGELLASLDGVELFARPPSEAKARRYRRWALESAALDLALGQAGIDLAALVGRAPRPLSFCASLSVEGGLDGAGMQRLEELYARLPGTRFKLDWSPGWGPATLARLAALDAVDVVDLKGHYHGDFRGPTPHAGAYLAVAEALPGAWLEDAWLGGAIGAKGGEPWEGATWQALEPSRDRLTWDAPLMGLDDLRSLPVEPRAINVKPSRFGTLAELVAVLWHCDERGIGVYAGGQFELGVGRRQLQLLASLFCPSAPNDCAPSAYNARELPLDLGASPMLADRGALGRFAEPI